jgi:uncharacterized repeat protein (TIGR03803 family)
LGIGLGLLRLIVVCLVIVVAAHAKKPPQETVLYNFGLSGGELPCSSPIADKTGTLYGTTQLSSSGVGTVFALSSSGVLTVLHNFSGGADGQEPCSRLVRDASGNLYGTTIYGGIYGYGTIFTIAPTGAEKVVYSFTGGSDGGVPYGGLLRDGKGNLYGTTYFGGLPNCNNGCGVVYELTTSGQLKVLYSFTGGVDGASPAATLIRDSKGNLYGTTYNGGSTACDFGCGTVFKVTKAGVETTLYSFQGGLDASKPAEGVIKDKLGNLYGTTSFGGSAGWGTVFMLAPTGLETVLYSFTGLFDGSIPGCVLARDAKGNLYGTTPYGGAGGSGVVFKVSATGTETVLHDFSGQPDGAGPRAGVVRVGSILYGTTAWGGTGAYGTVFKIVP